MKASKEVKELVMALKDRVCELDQRLIVDPRPKFNYEQIYGEIISILFLIEVELSIRKGRKK
jgi:hypothetical protein